MPKPFLPLEDHLLMLNEYAPYKVKMQTPHHPTPWFVLVGVDFSQQCALVTLGDAGGSTNQVQVEDMQPVLYSLADLPNLPGSNGHGYASPVGTFIHALNFIARGDHASGEWVNQVTVNSAYDAQLHLAFSTTYQPDTSGWSDRDFESDVPEDNSGADYEVIIHTYGTVYWRNVTADSLEGERVHNWRVAEGVNLFEAFRYLRQLHVAVGKAAYVHQEWSNADNKHTPHYSYVRKQLPAVIQEGGQADA